MSKAVQTQRRGGKYEAIGTLAIIVGIICLFLSPTFGGILLFGGFIVFLIGRFM